MKQKPKKAPTILAQTALGIAIVPALLLLIGEIFHIQGLEALILVSIIMILAGLLLRRKTRRFIANTLLIGGLISLTLATLNTAIPLIIAICIGIYLVLRKILSKANNPDELTPATTPTVQENQKTNFIIRNITLNLSNAILKDGEVELSIKGIIGNVVIWIPYDTEMTISTFTLFGTTTLLGNPRTQVRTENYDNTRRKLRIKVSVLLGDIEVKNI